MTEPQATNDGTPGADIPAILGAASPPVDWRELGTLPDHELHARLLQLRDDAHQRYLAYCRWIRLVRGRMRERGGQEPAARALGVSRAAVRKTVQK